jgi:hypothetical protein
MLRQFPEYIVIIDNLQQPSTINPREAASAVANAHLQGRDASCQIVVESKGDDLLRERFILGVNLELKNRRARDDSWTGPCSVIPQRQFKFRIDRR